VYVELLDLLRCPNGHEPTPLVAAVDRVVERSIETGTLACPVCGAEFAIRDGAGVFDSRLHMASQSASPAPPRPVSDEVRAAALLNLTEPGGYVLLGGTWAGAAARLSEGAGVAVVLLNPPGFVPGRGLVTPIYGMSLPIARGGLRGALLDADTEGIVAALRPRGRLAGPLEMAVPDGARELARDGQGWVAERVSEEPATVVGLRRSEIQSSG
jgi:uncharacterized protein YbaR (Trm112 family)